MESISQKTHQLKTIDQQAIMTFRNKILIKSMMKLKTRAFCNSKLRKKQYQHWEFTESFGEMIVKYISNLKSKHLEMLNGVPDIKELVQFLS